MPKIAHYCLKGSRFFSRCLSLLICTLVAGFSAISDTLRADPVFEIFIDGKPAGKVTVDASTNFDHRTFDILIDGTHRQEIASTQRRLPTAIRPIIFGWLFIASDRPENAGKDSRLRCTSLLSGSRQNPSDSRWQYWAWSGHGASRQYFDLLQPDEPVSSAKRTPHLLEYFLNSQPQQLTDITTPIIDIAIFNAELAVTMGEIHSFNTDTSKIETIHWTGNIVDVQSATFFNYFFSGYSRYQDGELTRLCIRAGRSYQIRFERPARDRRQPQKPVIETIQRLSAACGAGVIRSLSTQTNRFDNLGSTAASFSTTSGSGGSLFHYRREPAPPGYAINTPVNSFSGSCNTLVHISTYFATISTMIRL